MIVETRSGADAAGLGVDAVGVPVLSGADSPRLAVSGADVEATLGSPVALDGAWCERHGFSGKVGQVAWWPRPSSTDGAGGPVPEVVLVGCGDADGLTGEGGLESLRRAAAAFVRATDHAEAAAFLLPGDHTLPPTASPAHRRCRPIGRRPWPRAPCSPPTATTPTGRATPRPGWRAWYVVAGRRW